MSPRSLSFTLSSLPVLYECGVCGARLLGERRCEDCNRFMRRPGPAIVCPSCDEPILLADALQKVAGPA